MASEADLATRDQVNAPPNVRHGGRQGAGVGVEITRLAKRFGQVDAVAGISLAVPVGSFTTLLGPSGCGKSTTLRLIAGLERPDGGSITIGDRVVNSASVHVPPQQRRVGFVFQSYALWPHMTVAGHLAYAMRARNVPRKEIAARTTEILRLVGLAAMTSRYPYELSGGQQQRVAVARALAGDPQLLLLDEPLSNLDAELRAQMRVELRKLHDRTGLTTILVTHDQAEALSLSDKVVMMDGGKIVDAGPPREIYEKPESEATAAFVGSSNILEGIVQQDVDAGATVEVRFTQAPGCVASAVSPRQLSRGATVRIAIKPEDVSVQSANTSVSGASKVLCRVTTSTYYGSHFLCTLVEKGEGKLELRAWIDKTGAIAVGDDVVARLAPENLIVIV